MKVFVNELYEIVDVDTTDRTDVTEYELNDEQFKGKCIDFIRGYKYEPQYKFKMNTETGEIENDEDGNPIYELDDNGEKIQTGFSLYPYWDYNQLTQIQLEYENKQLVLALGAMIGGGENA